MFANTIVKPKRGIRRFDSKTSINVVGSGLKPDFSLESQHPRLESLG